jgi:hypothetical protein
MKDASLTGRVVLQIIMSWLAANPRYILFLLLGLAILVVLVCL